MVRVCCNFERALIHLREGKKVARESWPNTYFIMQNDTIDVYKKGIIKYLDFFTIEAILAEDWYIL